MDRLLVCLLVGGVGAFLPKPQHITRPHLPQFQHRPHHGTHARPHHVQTAKSLTDSGLGTSALHQPGTARLHMMVGGGNFDPKKGLSAAANVADEVLALVPTAIFFALLFSGKLNWLVDLVGGFFLLLLITPVLAFAAFNFWTSQNVLEAQCPTCGAVCQGIKNQAVPCLNCGQILLGEIEDGKFVRDSVMRRDAVIVDTFVDNSGEQAYSAKKPREQQSNPFGRRTNLGDDSVIDVDAS